MSAIDKLIDSLDLDRGTIVVGQPSCGVGGAVDSHCSEQTICTNLLMYFRSFYFR